MKFGFNVRVRQGAASPAATALVLLVLLGHAFVVSATHFHRGPRPGPVASAHGPRVAQPEGAQPAPLAGSHEQCLLCRLQRSFVPDLQYSAPVLHAPPAETLCHFNSPHASALQAHSLIPSGRAPPAA